MKHVDAEPREGRLGRWDGYEIGTRCEGVSYDGGTWIVVGTIRIKAGMPVPKVFARFVGRKAPVVAGQEGAYNREALRFQVLVLFRHMSRICDRLTSRHGDPWFGGGPPPATA